MRGTAVDDGEAAFTQRLQAADPALRDLTCAAETYDTVIITALATAIARTDAPAAVGAQINDVTRHGEECTNYATYLKLIQEGAAIDYDGASGPWTSPTPRAQLSHLMWNDRRGPS